MAILRGDELVAVPPAREPALRSPRVVHAYTDKLKYYRALGLQYGGRVLSEGVTFDDEANQDDLDEDEEIKRIDLDALVNTQNLSKPIS